MRFESVQAVLFDLDGTLIDSAPDLAAAADQLRMASGRDSLPLAAYRPLVGSGARGLLGLALEMGPEHPEFEQAKEAFFQAYETRLTELTTVFGGVADVIKSLEDRCMPWGVVTNKSQRFTLPLSQRLPLLTHAGVVISGDTTPHAKPHPEPLLEAARRLGVAPAHCVYIGDDERDVQAGRAAGMRTVVATYGYLGQDADVSTWGADQLVESPQALLPRLGR
jgi:phosphoglycolate phosphatase